jgi:hypothetical protein
MKYHIFEFYFSNFENRRRGPPYKYKFSKMPPPVYAKIVHGGKIQTVALFPGLQKEELVSLIKTVFTVSGNVVGFLAEVIFSFN